MHRTAAQPPGRDPLPLPHLPHLTSVSTDEVTAGGAVLAGIRRTFIKLLLTVAPRVAKGTLAVVCGASIYADA